MKSRPLSNDIFLANHILATLEIVAILGVFSNLLFPKHNAFYLGLIKSTDILVLVAFLYWLVGPSLFALFSSFVISRFFNSTSSAIAATVSSILFISAALSSYYYTWFIDTSESSWMALLIWPVVQFIVYVTVLVITWPLSVLTALTIRTAIQRSKESVKQPAP